MTTVWAVGDGASGGQDATLVANMIFASNPDIFIYLGDVYESGTANEFEHNYAPSWGQMDGICFPIKGNHDARNYSTGYQPYFSGKGRPADPWYVQEIAGWQFLFLDSESPAHGSSPQYEWAQQQVAMATDRKRVFCFHRPRYCNGSHGNATDLDDLYQLLAPHCIALLSGHAHNVQQFTPDQTGCVQFVSGAGGRALYAEVTQSPAGNPSLQYGEASGYAALKLELDAPAPNQIAVSWVAESGSVLYQSTLSL
jgi:predicted phosphodiesterase